MFNTLQGDASLNIYFCSYFLLLLFSLKLSVWNGEEKATTVIWSLSKILGPVRFLSLLLTQKMVIQYGIYDVVK